MSRFVEPTPLPLPNEPVATAEGVEAQPTSSNSDATERIVKYVPSEIVTGYLFVMGLAQAAPEGQLRVLIALLIFIIGFIVTPLFLVKVYKPKREQRPQVWIATIAFPLWAYALGGPFAMPPMASYYQGWVGAVLVGLYSWVVGLFYEPREQQHRKV